MQLHRAQFLSCGYVLISPLPWWPISVSLALRPYMRKQLVARHDAVAEAGCAQPQTTSAAHLHCDKQQGPIESGFDPVNVSGLTSQAAVQTVPDAALERSCGHLHSASHEHHNQEGRAAIEGQCSEGKGRTMCDPDSKLDVTEIDSDLKADVAEELAEVLELWQQQLAWDVGLPGLRLQQNAGAVLVVAGSGVQQGTCGWVGFELSRGRWVLGWFDPQPTGLGVGDRLKRKTFAAAPKLTNGLGRCFAWLKAFPSE